MRPKAKRPDTEAEAARGRSLQIYNTGSSRIGLAFRTRPTALTQAHTQTGAATKSQNDPIREERPRGQTWREATFCTASSGVYSRAARLSLRQLRPIGRTSPSPLYPQHLETKDLSRKTGTPALAQRVLVLNEKTLNCQQGPNGAWVGRLPSGTSVREDARYPLPPLHSGPGRKSHGFWPAVVHATPLRASYPAGSPVLSKGCRRHGELGSPCRRRRGAYGRRCRRGRHRSWCRRHGELGSRRRRGSHGTLPAS